MNTTRAYAKIVLLLGVAIFTAAFARVDTNSSTNFQSKFAGVVQHVDLPLQLTGLYDLFPLGDGVYLGAGMRTKSTAHLVPITADENSVRSRFGGARFLDRCQKGCCPGEGVRSPSNFEKVLSGNSNVTI